MLMNDYKAVSPEIQIRNTIVELKTQLRLVNDELSRMDENYRKNRKILEDKKDEFQKLIESWTRLEVDMKEMKNTRVTG